MQENKPKVNPTGSREPVWFTFLYKHKTGSRIHNILLLLSLTCREEREALIFSDGIQSVKLDNLHGFQIFYSFLNPFSCSL
jgi:hypothetical protein